jgi:hypothetical protein
MCNDVTLKADVEGTGHAKDEQMALGSAVVSFVHPLELQAEHAVCIDFRGSSGEPADRIAVELSLTSARRLAELVIEALDA